MLLTLKVFYIFAFFLTFERTYFTNKFHFLSILINNIILFLYYLKIKFFLMKILFFMFMFKMIIKLLNISIILLMYLTF